MRLVQRKDQSLAEIYPDNLGDYEDVRERDFTLRATENLLDANIDVNKESGTDPILPLCCLCLPG